jgi:hypothetical protein
VSNGESEGASIKVNESPVSAGESLNVSTTETAPLLTDTQAGAGATSLPATEKMLLSGTERVSVVVAMALSAPVPSGGSFVDLMPSAGGGDRDDHSMGTHGRPLPSLCDWPTFSV